jgi:hypothetical protein
MTNLDRFKFVMVGICVALPMKDRCRGVARATQTRLQCLKASHVLISVSMIIEDLTSSRFRIPIVSAHPDQSVEGFWTQSIRASAIINKRPRFERAVRLLPTEATRRLMSLFGGTFQLTNRRELDT